MSRIELNIDRLVLDGVELSPGDAYRLGAAIERELSDLIAKDGAPQRGANEWRVSGPAITLAPGGDVQGWGRQIAHSIHRSLPGGKVSG